MQKVHLIFVTFFCFITKTKIINGAEMNLVEKIVAAGKGLLLEKTISLSSNADRFCSYTIKRDIRPNDVIPNIEEVGLILMDNKYNRTFRIGDIDELLNFETFNKDFNTVILSTGWFSLQEQLPNPAKEIIYSAYKCRGKTNFIVYDEANYVATLPYWSAMNTIPLGQFLAEFISKMTTKVSVRKFHLIGHSLGAHISGEAGRHFQKLRNKKLPRITGLDPALVCFNGTNSLPGIKKEDADFVDIIHTNSGVLGIKIPVGDVDFYPNGDGPLQPGSFEIASSHFRAYELYGESVYPGAENTFLAMKCDSFSSFTSGSSTGPEIPMGFATPSTSPKGSYFLTTKSTSPYGKAKINSCERSPNKQFSFINLLRKYLRYE